MERAEGRANGLPVEQHPGVSFQLGAVPPQLPPAPPTKNFSFYFRRLLFSLVCILAFVALDRTTVFLQIWPSISAWYPPAGLLVALVVGLGAEILPALLIASYLAGFVNYHQDPTGLAFLLINPLVVAIYGATCLYLRRKLPSDFRISSVRDVAYFSGISLVASMAVASFGTAIFVWTGEIPRAEYLRAAFNWWVGDAVALSSVAPFLLEFVIPWSRRYLGLASPAELASSRARPPWIWSRANFAESLGFLAALALVTYLAFGNSFAHGAHLFYLFFLPLIWIAIRRGLRGVIVALILVDSSLAIMMRVVHQGIDELAVIQFLMLILALTALILGGIIGERKQAELRLSEEEERIRLILESTAEGIYGIDENGICTFVNPAALQILGFSSRQEVLGKNFHALCHHSYPDGAPFPFEKCRIVLAFRSGTPSHANDEVFWRANGTSFPVEYWSHPVFRNGRAMGSVVTFLDISERRAFETAIRESELRFRAIFEGAEIGIAIVDLKTGILTVNSAYQRMLGCSAVELQRLGMFDDLTHPDDVLADKASFERLVAGELDRLHFDKRYLLRDSRLVWASVELSILRDPLGKPQFILGLAVDITERKHAEEELRASEHQLRAFIEDAPVCVAMFDRDIRYIATSRRWFNDFNFGRDSLVGLRLYDVLPDLPEKWRESHRRALAGEKQHLGEEIWTRADGTAQWISSAVYPWRDPQGNIGGIIISADDMSQRKRFEDQLKHATRAAEAASEAKSTFLATMSHEIRTPLNGILGMTELVLDTPLTSDQRENLGLVRFSAESLLSIINDILDFSKIEAGKLVVEHLPFNLRQSLQETIKTCAIRAGQKDIDLQFDPDPSVPEAFIGDPGRIRQIVLNLIGNAIKFTERGTISVAITAAFPVARRSLLHFSVTDTGIGISPEAQEKIFAAFSQADGSMARKYGGSGLGLAICVRLVEMMGGQIWVESAPSVGSTFHFTADLALQEVSAALPAGQLPSAHSGPALASAPTQPLDPSPARPVRVLLVEDNAVNRTLALRLLQKRGFIASHASDGKQALLAFDSAEFDIILMDLQMPEMDGFEATAEIRKREKLTGRRTPIIALTAHALKEDRERCISAGMDAYVTKPIRPDELFSTIQQLLQSSARSLPAPLDSPVFSPK